MLAQGSFSNHDSFQGGKEITFADVFSSDKHIVQACCAQTMKQM